MQARRGVAGMAEREESWSWSGIGTVIVALLHTFILCGGVWYGYIFFQGVIFYWPLWIVEDGIALVPYVPGLVPQFIDDWWYPYVTCDFHAYGLDVEMF